MSEHEEKHEAKKKSRAKSRAKKIALLVAASLTGISTAAVASTVVVYDSFFARYERPE